MFKWLVYVVVGVIVLGAISSVMNNAGFPIARQSDVSSAAPSVDKSPQMQTDRKKLIEELIDSGVFQKVEVPGNLPRLWVRPAFYALEFDRKASFVSVVYAYYFNGANDADSVRIYDSRSGKEVGRYSTVAGGLEMF